MPTLDAEEQDRIRRTFRRTGSVKATVRETGHDRDTVRKYIEKPDAGDGPDPLAAPPEPGCNLPRARHEPLPALPPSLAVDFAPFVIDTPGHWGILCDPHIPYHDRTTIELFMAECVRRDVSGILINGDYLDSHEVSRHDKDPSAPRYKDEVEYGQQGLAYIRGRRPRSRIVLKFGNHDERVENYVIRNAPALFGMPGVNLESFLACEKYGVEVVKDKRVIHLGKLNVIHGHEYQGGSADPAKRLSNKARSVACCGHHHQTGQYVAVDIRDRPESAWSIGASCHLKPKWLPLNNWNHGFAFVEVDNRGEFVFENKRVWQGKVI